MSIYLPVFLSASLSSHMSIYLRDYLSNYIHIYLYVYQSTCPSTSTKNITDEEMARLSRGTPMGIGEMCRNGGYNATTGKATAWVDNQGYKHLYNDFRNKHTSCPDSTVTVSDIQFDAIPTGNSYGSDEKCEVMSLDSENYDNIFFISYDLLERYAEYQGRK